MSESLAAKVVEAHDLLWNKVVELSNLPSPYGATLGMLHILQPKP